MQPASPSPLYASPLSSVGYSTELPAGYRVSRLGREGYEVVSDDYGVIEDEIGSEFESYAAACFAAQDHHAKMVEAEEKATREAYEDEIQDLWNLVNAQGGYVAPADKLGQARSRAIDAVLAAIDALSQKAA